MNEQMNERLNINLGSYVGRILPICRQTHTADSIGCRASELCVDRSRSSSLRRSASTAEYLPTYVEQMCVDDPPRRITALTLPARRCALTPAEDLHREAEKGNHFSFTNKSF